MNNKLNYILIHLESLNNLLLKLHPECFPNILKIKEMATSYDNYYSSSTSTYMVITDLLFGEINQLENSDYLENIFSIKTTKPSLLDVLSAQGYYVKQFCFGNDETEANRQRDILCQNADIWANDNLSIHDFIVSFEKDVGYTTPFAFFIENVISHITRVPKYESDECSGVELYLKRYRQLDESIGVIFNVLEQKYKLGDTVVVMYGDHGDDLFSHGYHNGYMHAIEPYSFMVHCPLFIYSPVQPSGIVRDLTSTIDIYKLSLSYLGIEKYDVDNKFVFSRNLFSKQKISSKSFNKSYSVTDGEYTLLVSADGLKLYNNKIDSFNNWNLLDLFKLNEGQITYNKKYDYYESGHMKAFVSAKFLEEISSVFTALYNQLFNHVSQLYQGKVNGMNFKRIDYFKQKYKLDYELYLRILKGKILASMSRELKDRLKKYFT